MTNAIEEQLRSRLLCIKFPSTEKNVKALKD